jgi:hypothetical protein
MMATPTGNLTAYDYVLRGNEYGQRENKLDDEHALETKGCRIC